VFLTYFLWVLALFSVDSFVVSVYISFVVYLAGLRFVFCFVCFFCSLFCVLCGDLDILLSFVRPIFVD
jgi:hypothetical protein